MLCIRAVAQKEQLQKFFLYFHLLRPLLRIKRLSWFGLDAFIVFLGSTTLYNDEGKLGPHKIYFGFARN